MNSSRVVSDELSSESRFSLAARWGLAFACVLGVAFGVGIALLAGGVAAQETGANSSDLSGAIADIDSEVRLVDYRYYPEVEEFSITLENTGSERSRVQIMEIMDLSEERDAPLGMRSVSLRSGETVEISVSAQLSPANEAGAVVMTEESLERGEVFPVTYSDGLPSVFDGDSEWSDVWAGSLAALAFGVVGLLLGMWEVVAKKNEDVTEVPIE